MPKEVIVLTCGRCEGKGHIPGFAHVANGRCFNCGGAGTVTNKKSSVTFSRAFVNQFKKDTYFPEGFEGEKINCLAFKGHPTAEKWLLKKEAFYYIGQPVCRASLWYQVPEAEILEFAKHYLKACYQDIFLKS